MPHVSKIHSVPTLSSRPAPSCPSHSCPSLLLFLVLGLLRGRQHRQSLFTWLGRHAPHGDDFSGGESRRDELGGAAPDASVVLASRGLNYAGVSIDASYVMMEGEGG